MKYHIPKRKNSLPGSCFLMILLMACNNNTDGQKPQTTATAQIDTSLVWIDYRIGELAPYSFYAGLDSLVKKYKLRYQRIEAGCEVGKTEELLKTKYDQQNQRYFKEMEKIHGKDWKKRFDVELQVLDSINEVRAKQTQLPFSIKGQAGFWLPEQVFHDLMTDEGKAPLNNFYVVGYNLRSGEQHAWVYWREGNAVILWEPTIDSTEPASLSMSRRYLWLNKDVVNSDAEVGTSTYLVTRDWVNGILRDCRKYGDHFIIRRTRNAL